MTLLLTLFLVLINIFNSVSSNSLNAEGFTAISTWIISCILFVFAFQLENVFSRKYTLFLQKDRCGCQNSPMLLQNVNQKSDVWWTFSDPNFNWGHVFSIASGHK